MDGDYSVYKERHRYLMKVLEELKEVGEVMRRVLLQAELPVVKREEVVSLQIHHPVVKEQEVILSRERLPVVKKVKEVAPQAQLPVVKVGD